MVDLPVAHAPANECHSHPAPSLPSPLFPSFGAFTRALGSFRNLHCNQERPSRRESPTPVLMKRGRDGMMEQIWPNQQLTIPKPHSPPDSPNPPKAPSRAPDIRGLNNSPNSPKPRSPSFTAWAQAG